MRPGAITKEMFEKIIGPVKQPTHIEQKAGAPRAPGMKYTHYAPNAPVYLIEQDEQQILQAIQTIHQQGKKVALLAPQSYEHLSPNWFFTLGENKEEMAANLFHALRACDLTDTDIVLATVTGTDGVGSAIMNRLEKSAGGKWFATDYQK